MTMVEVPGGSVGAITAAAQHPETRGPPRKRNTARREDGYATTLLIHDGCRVMQWDESLASQVAC